MTTTLIFDAGEAIGPYRLVRHIGSGAFGEVWQAERDAGLGVKVNVALKLQDSRMFPLEQIRREVRVWSRVSDHPHILPLIGVDEYQRRGANYVGIASQYVAGGSLADWLLRQPHGVADGATACRIVCGILEALEYMHGWRDPDGKLAPIVHRDLKTANVLMNGAMPLVADLGLANIIEGSRDYRMTQHLSGTLAYMPPEALDGHVSPRMDIWASGVMLYQLMSGHLPFERTDRTALIKAIVLDPVPPLPVPVPDGVRRVLEQALQKEENQRYRTVAKMRAELETAWAEFRHASLPSPSQQVTIRDYDAERRELAERLAQEETARRAAEAEMARLRAQITAQQEEEQRRTTQRERQREALAQQERERAELARQQKAREEAAQQQRQLEALAQQQREHDEAARQQRAAEERREAERQAAAQRERQAQQQRERQAQQQRANAARANDQPKPPQPQGLFNVPAARPFAWAKWLALGGVVMLSVVLLGYALNRGKDATPDNGTAPVTTASAKPADYTATLPNGVKLEMVAIPAGTFQMGSTNGGSDEKPVHSVRLTQPFLLGRYEVTQAQWRAVMGTTIEQQRDKCSQQYNTTCNLYGTGDNYPMYYVSWDEVQEFIKRLNAGSGGGGYRLPTEAEWEYAARAGSGGDYGNVGGRAGALAEMGWYDGNSGNASHAIGQKKANDWGLYDMHGNVWEWCSDWYGDYSSDAVTNPTGAAAGSDRVYRGGSWNSTATYARAAYRFYNTPDSRGSVGFRLARTPA